MSHRDRVLTLILLFACLGWAERIRGQDNANNGANAAAAKTEETIREQTIYIPYEKLQKTFEKEGRGVFLPYEKFQQLWKAARQQTEGTEPPKRPVDALINAIESDATIGDQVVNVNATLQLEILGKGWVKIPLRLRESAIRTATLNGQPARVVFDARTGYQLLYEKEGDESAQLELKLEYTRAFTKTPGQSSVTFEAPRHRSTVARPSAGSGDGGRNRADDCRHARPRGRARQRCSTDQPARFRSPARHWYESPGIRRPKKPVDWPHSPPFRRSSRSSYPKVSHGPP